MCIHFPGVKNADENELRSIASEPHNTHVYNVADFNIMSSIVEGLTKRVCEQVEQQDKDIKDSKETRCNLSDEHLALERRTCTDNHSNTNISTTNGKWALFGAQYPDDTYQFILAFQSWRLNHIAQNRTTTFMSFNWLLFPRSVERKTCTMKKSKDFALILNACWFFSPIEKSCIMILFLFYCPRTDTRGNGTPTWLTDIWGHGP